MTEAHHPPKQGRLGLLVSLLFSVGAIALLFRQVNLSDLAEGIRNADPLYLALMMAIYPLGMLLRAYRWCWLLEAPLPFWRGFHIVNIAYLFNTVLPFRLGEVTRILLMGREPKHSAGEAISATTLERLFDLLIALGCVGMGLVLLPEEADLPRRTTNSIGILIGFVGVGMAVLLFAPPLYPFFLRVLTLLTSRIPYGDSIYRLADDTLTNLRHLATPSRLLTTLGLSLLTWAGYICFFYLGLGAFFPSLPPLGVGFLVMGITALGIAAPSLPGAIGVFQAAAVLALNTAGYDTTIATSYAWTIWLGQTVWLLLGGVIGLWGMSLSFGELRQEVRGRP